MSGRPAAESRRLKAHFVGAPFYVPPGLSNIEHRFAATGFNTGNLLIGDATARIANVDICHYGSGLRSESDNAGTDLIVIPSANFLSPAMDLSWLLPTIENSKQPIFMLGVGAQFPTTSVKRATLPDSTVRLMRLISERCHSIGARGPFTADVLRKYGISNVRVTGCPSLFRMGLPELTVSRPKSTADIRAVFNGSSNVLGHAYSETDARRAERRLFELAIDMDAPYVLQNEFAEIQAAYGLDQREWGAQCASTHSRLQLNADRQQFFDFLRTKAKCFFDVLEWQKFVSEYNVVIGSRFHGNMIAISQGIAAVFVAHDSRTTELCETLQIPYVGLKTFIKARIEDLIESLDYSAFEKNYVVARANLVTFFNENRVPHRLDGLSGNLEQALVASVAHFRALNPEVLKLETIRSVDVAEQPPSDDPVTQLKQRLADRDYDGAILTYYTVQSSHKKFIGATSLLAHALISPNPPVAVELARKAISLGADDCKSHYILAAALANDDRLIEAKQVATDALNLYGANSDWSDELRNILGR